MRKQKATVIGIAQRHLFTALGLEDASEFDIETTQQYMRGVWKIAYKKGRARGTKARLALLLELRGRKHA